MDELTLLRRLVVDEPMDDETARDEVWRRLCDGKTSVGRPATTTHEPEEATRREAAAGWSQGRHRRRWGLVTAAAVLLLGGLLVTPALGIGSRLLDLFQDSPGFAPSRPTRKPVWSPDGRKILYVTRSDRKTRDLYVINVDGSGQRMLASVTSASAAWSPDGRKIVFSDARAPTASHPSRSTGLWVINADGSGKRRLALRAYDPVWSPDGHKIAFAQGTRLYVRNADGTGSKRLAGNGSSPAWSPDGGKIVFLNGAGTGCDFCFNVYVVNADGSGERRLTHNATPGLGGDFSPAWSPDGQRIAFVRRRRHPTGLDVGAVWVMRADGRGQRKLARERFAEGRSVYARVAWSPDGRKLTFTSNRDGNADVYTINSDGSGLRRLTNNPEYDGDAVWSPDGRRIVFVSDRGGNSEVYVMDADGSGQRRLTAR